MFLFSDMFFTSLLVLRYLYRLQKLQNRAATVITGEKSNEIL